MMPTIPTQRCAVPYLSLVDSEDTEYHSDCDESMESTKENNDAKSQIHENTYHSSTDSCEAWTWDNMVQTVPYLELTLT